VVVCEYGITEYILHFYHDQMIVFLYYKHYIFDINTAEGGDLTPKTIPLATPLLHNDKNNYRIILWIHQTIGKYT